MQNEFTLCSFCDEPIRNGRSDKKFCNSGCKDAYYNGIKTVELKEISKVDGILKRNRRILRRLYDPKKEQNLIKREVLLKAGFEFGFHTHTVVTKFKGNEFTFCYDIGYRELPNGIYQVVASFSKVKIKNGDEFNLKRW